MRGREEGATKKIGQELVFRSGPVQGIRDGGEEVLLGNVLEQGTAAEDDQQIVCENGEIPRVERLKFFFF